MSLLTCILCGSSLCCHGFCLFQAAGKASGDTALHVACYYGKADAARALVVGGANPNKENEVGVGIVDHDKMDMTFAAAFFSFFFFFSRWD